MVATPSTYPTMVPTFGVNVLREALARAHRQEPEHGARLDRAACIVATRTIERTAGGWLVESEREPARYYLVSQSPPGVPASARTTATVAGSSASTSWPCGSWPSPSAWPRARKPSRPRTSSRCPRASAPTRRPPSPTR